MESKNAWAENPLFQHQQGRLKQREEDLRRTDVTVTSLGGQQHCFWEDLTRQILRAPVTAVEASRAPAMPHATLATVVIKLRGCWGPLSAPMRAAAWPNGSDRGLDGERGCCGHACDPAALELWLSCP